MRIDNTDKKLVMNVITRIKKIIESNPAFYSDKGSEDLQEILTKLESKKDSLDNLIIETQKIKQEVQDKLEMATFKINDMRRLLLENLEGTK